VDQDPENSYPSKNSYQLPSKVAILYSDVKREYFSSEEAYLTEKGAEKYSEIVADYTRKLGIEVKLMAGNSSLPSELKIYKPDIVFNFVDTFEGSDRDASIVPGVLELLDIPYVGSGTLGIALSANKYLVSKLLQANGIPVAHSQLFLTANDYIDPTLRFPLISKLNETHGSVELNQDAVSENEKHLRDRLKYLTSRYREQILVEEYIVGREVSAVLLEGLNKKVYIGEKIFTHDEGKYKITSFQVKWGSETKQALSFQRFHDPILKEYTKKAFSVLSMYDYSRFDIRIDESGRYFFLDCNANPFFCPPEVGGSMALILDLYGVSFIDTLKRLMVNTIRDSLGEARLSFPKAI